MRSLLAMDRVIYRSVSVGMALLAALTLVVALFATAEAAPRGGGGHGGGGNHGGGGRGGGNHGGGWRGGHGHGGHWHGGGHWQGGWRGGCCWGPRFYGFFGFPFAYPYAYPYRYAYPSPYAYPGPVYSYSYAAPVYAPVIESQPQVGYQNGGAYQPPAVQREVVFPNGKYVLYGDGVTQAWRWVWVPNGS